MVMKISKETIMSECEFSYHISEQLQYRFGITPSYVKEKINFKIGKSMKYDTIRKKVQNYPHQLPIYSEEYNLLMMLDVYTKKITTAMNLDGTDGKLSYYEKLSKGLRVKKV